MIWAITAVRLSDGKQERHITTVLWLNTTNGTTGQSAVSVMVDFIDTRKNEVCVGGSEGWAKVGVVKPAGHPPYLRSHLDGTWTDNLLFLPRF